MNAPVARSFLEIDAPAEMAVPLSFSVPLLAGGSVLITTALRLL